MDKEEHMAATKFRGLIADLKDQLSSAQARVRELEHNIAHWGVIEFMTRNPNVDSFVKELERRLAELEEGRPTDLEAAYDSLSKLYVQHRDENEQLKQQIKELNERIRVLHKTV